VERKRQIKKEKSREEEKELTTKKIQVIEGVTSGF
jgi:hypothetical protein